jgi:hypothetical protein
MLSIGARTKIKRAVKALASAIAAKIAANELDSLPNEARKCQSTTMKSYNELVDVKAAWAHSRRF